MSSIDLATRDDLVAVLEELRAVRREVEGLRADRAEETITLDEHLSDGDLRLLRPEAVAQLDHLRSSALAALYQAGLSLPPG